MIFSFLEQLPDRFSPRSRVWIYQGDRTFREEEKRRAEEMIRQFTDSWNSHGAKVNGFGRIIFDRFVVLIADETEATVSGCSTDSSVQLIRELEHTTGVGLFNRQLLAFVISDQIQLVPFTRLSSAVRENKLAPETLFFNNAVTTLAEMRSEWLIPAGESWLQHRAAFVSSPR